MSEVCWRNGPDRGFRLFRLNLKYLYFKQNSVYSDRTPHSGASDLGLHCLPVSQYTSPVQIVQLTKPFHAKLQCHRKKSAAKNKHYMYLDFVHGQQ